MFETPKKKSPPTPNSKKKPISPGNDGFRYLSEQGRIKSPNARIDTHLKKLKKDLSPRMKQFEHVKEGLFEDGVDLTTFWNSQLPGEKYAKDEYNDDDDDFKKKFLEKARARTVTDDNDDSFNSLIDLKPPPDVSRETPFKKKSPKGKSPKGKNSKSQSPNADTNELPVKPEKEAFKVDPIIIRRIPRVGDVQFTVTNVIDEIKANGKGHLLEPISPTKTVTIVTKTTKRKIPIINSKRTRSYIWSSAPKKFLESDDLEYKDLLELDASLQYIKTHPDKISDDEAWNSFVGEYVESKTPKNSQKSI